MEEPIFMAICLVTGAKGHTGSFLVKLLLEKGCKVIATDLPPRERSELMTKETVFRQDFQYMNCEDWDAVTFIPADLTQKETLRPLFKCGQIDIIFHPASFYDYFAELPILRKINVEGLRNMLDVSLEELGHIPRFIHWSTCGVYGEPTYARESITKLPIAADETAPFDPPNAYSISKKEQEELLQEYRVRLGEKFRFTIMRSAPIYGPYQMYGAFHIMYMCNKMGHMVAPVVFPKHEKLMMPMIHVETLVEAAWFLSQNDKSVGEAYNIIEDSLTQEEWMEFMYQVLGITYTHVPIWWPLYKFSAKLIRNFVEDQNKKARAWGLRPKIDLSMADYITHQYYFSNAKLKALGFKLKYNSYDGTLQTIRWYKDHGWLESEYYEPMQEAKL
jgi:nucleoside-diphosphate-sugar epimerase